MRYRFYEGNNIVVCVSSFAKKPVKGVAKCSPNDNFDSNIGRTLAQLRCDNKVAKKRVQRALRKLKYDEETLNMVQKWVNDSRRYYDDSVRAYNESTYNLNKFENNLK